MTGTTMAEIAGVEHGQVNTAPSPGLAAGLCLPGGWWGAAGGAGGAGGAGASLGKYVGMAGRSHGEMNFDNLGMNTADNEAVLGLIGV